MKRFIYVFIAIIICSCSSKVTKQDSTSHLIDPISVEISYVGANEIHFKVTNTNHGVVFIHQHPRLNIERQTDGLWQPLRILPCPCGAPCAKPAEFIEFPENAQFSYKWNKQESWCGEMGSMPVPETITQPVSSGSYRLTIYYSLDQKNVQKFYKEFTID